MNKEDAWLTTYTGKQFYPWKPNPDDIDIHDIAHSLSNICRYNGHCNIFYSVAEHCVRLVDIVPNHCKPYALMHDAAEAYFSDVPSLIKRALPDVMDMESHLIDMILVKYAIAPVPYRTVYETAKNEQVLLVTEVRDLGINPTGWQFSEYPLDTTITPMSPEFAEAEFIRMFAMRGIWRKT